MNSENRELKLDEVLEEIQYLKQENHDLKVENDFLRRMKRGLMLNNQELTQERNQLCDELNRIKALGMFEFADKYCNDNELEEAGHQFARSLLGGASL